MGTRVTVRYAVPPTAGMLDLEQIPPSERDRVSRRRRADDRSAVLAAWVIASRMVASRLGVQPAELEVERRCARCGSEEHGKPQFRDSGLHLSLSHTPGGAVVAVSPDSPVGVDIEPVVVGAPPAEEARLWTAREAVVKCLGYGLGGPLEGPMIDLSGPEPTVGRWDEQPDLPREIQLRVLAVPDGYAATLAVRSTDVLEVVSAAAGTTLA